MEFDCEDSGEDRMLVTAHPEWHQMGFVFHRGDEAVGSVYLPRDKMIELAKHILVTWNEY